jgi:hypothetical protein
MAATPNPTPKRGDLPYAKLVNLTVFSDGMQFHESNRRTGSRVHGSRT